MRITISRSEMQTIVLALDTVIDQSTAITAITKAQLSLSIKLQNFIDKSEDSHNSETLNKSGKSNLHNSITRISDLTNESSNSTQNKEQNILDEIESILRCAAETPENLTQDQEDFYFKHTGASI